MHIQEVEGKTGLTRANIRFYEREGLIAPARQSDGCRDYSQEDVDALLRIRLLRELGFSRQTVGRVQRGEVDFQAILEEHIQETVEEERRQQSVRTVCTAMREAGETYATLNARPYLDRYYQGLSSRTREPDALAEDELPPEPHPWRRWMARGVDILLINAGLLLVWCVFLHHFFQRVSSFWLTVAVLVLLFLLEPVFLHLWGTTPGKWIMGISIRDEGGGKPSWSQAWLRTWGMLHRGLGFSIPLYNLYRGYRSYRTEQAGEKEPWDESADTMVCFRDDRLWRPLAAVGAWCLLFGCLVGIGTASLLPPNRGDLTVEEFVENYQWYADQLDMGTWQLQPSGEFVWEGSNAFSVLEPESLAPLRWMEEDGILTGISLEMGQEERWAGDICVEESNSYSPTAQTLASLALVGARAPLFSARDLLNQVLAWGVEVDTGSLTLAGVTLARETELEGWEASGGYLFRADGAENCRMAMDVTLTVG